MCVYGGWAQGNQWSALNCHSVIWLLNSVSQHHREALTLAKDRNALRVNLTDSEFTIECHLKQLAVLHAEQKELKGALAQLAGKEAKRTPTTMDGGEDEGQEF